MTVRKTYTEEFKLEAVRLAKERGNVSQTALDLGITSNLLHESTRQLEHHGGNSFKQNQTKRFSKLFGGYKLISNKGFSFKKQSTPTH